MSEPSNILLEPCHHICLCEGCQNKTIDNKCPICQHEIMDRIKVYIT